MSLVLMLQVGDKKSSVDFKTHNL